MNSMNPNDHDLLIKVDTKLDNLTKEMAMMRDDNSRRLDRVEQNKVEKSDFEAFKKEMETNVSSITRNVYIGMGIVAALSFATQIFLQFYLR